MEYYSAIKKEYIGVCSNEVDEPRAYYTKLKLSQKEKVSFTNAYIPMADLCFPGISDGKKSACNVGDMG